MDLNIILDRLWNDYSAQNPSAAKIYNLFKSEGEEVVNDHIAFRTLDYPGMNIDVVATPFIQAGYEAKGEYYFTEKHLYAKHFESVVDINAPRIFISQLVIAQCSSYARSVLSKAAENLVSRKVKPENLIFSGEVINPVSFDVYNKLRQESEYAAWFYVFGFRANHFTVSINALKKFSSVEEVNIFLKHHGFKLNDSGGEIKGTKADLLQQSSTLADRVKIVFEEGTFEVPCCYYEFAHRFHDKNGQLYGGFVASSADKIFESTDFHKKDR